MLRAIIEWCLNFRLVVMLLAVGLLAGGAFVIRGTPLDVFPEFAPPQATIQTEAPGLPADLVEQLVTRLIESELSGTPQLKTLRSQSAAGLSVVTAVFEDHADIRTVRNLLAERIGELTTQLPAGVGPPRLEPLSSSTSRVYSLGLTTRGKTTSLTDIRQLAELTWRQRLRSVPGVAKVELFGGEVKQYQIVARPEQLARYDLTLEQLAAACKQATSLGGAGFVESPNQRMPIRQSTRIESADDLAAVPVGWQHGSPIPLGEVASVHTGSADKVGDALINGQRGVLLLVHKQPSANALEVTRAVERAVAELKPGLPVDVLLHDSLFRHARTIQLALHNLEIAILIGCGLTTLILIGFLGHWRTVAISLTAIPLSLLGGTIILRLCGASLNAMTLGGLAIAVGEVVDDAIVDVENILRRWRENIRLGSPRSAFRVVLEASLEVRSAVVYATFVVILVFLPVLLMQGLEGAFFRPLAYAYIASILASLLVAVTLTPALCLVLLPHSSEKSASEPLLVRGLKAVYVRLLPPVLRFGWTAAGLAVLLMVAAVGGLLWLEQRFLPEFHETDWVVQMNVKNDGSLAESVRLGKSLVPRLLEIPHVTGVSQQVGRSDLSEDTWSPNISELWISLDDESDYAKTLEAINAETEKIKGCTFDTKQYLKERIDEVLTGAKGSILVRVVGPDLEQLQKLADGIGEVMKGVPGTNNVTVEALQASAEVRFLVRPQRAARYGLTPGQVHDTAAMLVHGQKVGQVLDGQQLCDVVLRGFDGPPDDPRALRDLILDTPDRDRVRAGSLADLDIALSPQIIPRHAGSRRIEVSCNVTGRGAATVADLVQHRIHEKYASLPAGYHLEFAGEKQAVEEASLWLWVFGGVSLLGIFALLYLDFGSLRETMLVLLSAPLVVVGGVLAVHLSGGVLSLGSLVGFVTVLGIAVRNGILLISHYDHLRREEGVPLSRELIIRGALERLAPILMTASTAGLSLLPLVVFGDRPGYEIEHPMAVVILGGLVSSTLLSLFLIPALYERFAPRDSQSARAA